MTPEQKYKLERCGTLLAQSPLDDSIKMAVIENMGKMTDGNLDELLRMLERETFELAALQRDLKALLARQEEGWKEVESQQEALAQKMADKALQAATTGN